MSSNGLYSASERHPAYDADTIDAVSAPASSSLNTLTARLQPDNNSLRNHLRPRFLAHVFILTLPVSSLKVKVTDHRSELGLGY